MSIPLNNIVKINPGVLDVGNNGNNLSGLMLTKELLLPVGQTTTFISADQVAEIFGYTSNEYKLANVYFSGFTNSDRVAEQLYIAPYYTKPLHSMVFGGSLEKLTLEELRELSGEFSFEIKNANGATQYKAKDVDLTYATSFSDGVSKLNKSIVDDEGNTAPVSITFSSSKSIVIKAKNIDDEIQDVYGVLAENLRLKPETGAKSFARDNSSESNDISVSDENNDISASELLNILRQTNLSFCSVFLSWGADDTEKLEFAKWANSMKDDVCVILNDTEENAINDNSLQSNSPSDNKLSFAEKVKKLGYEGVVCVYDNLELCAFIAGYPAAWDLSKTDGRFTAAFRRNSLLSPNVTNEKDALTLKAKGYNFYGVWASATSNFTFMYEGRISGQYVWLDSWFCQVWMRRQFQYYFVLTLLSKGQIPYNTDGKGILTTAIKPAIDQFMNFGSIRPGINLSDYQVQTLKQAGLNQSQINNITTVGYYLKVDMAGVSPQTRVKRGSPPINFWYTDGQSVQQINMNSIEIQ